MGDPLPRTGCYRLGGTCGSRFAHPLAIEAVRRVPWGELRGCLPRRRKREQRAEGCDSIPGMPKVEEPVEIVPMTDEELAAISRRRRRWYLVIAVILLVLAIGAGLLASRFITLGWNRTHPLDHVTQVSKGLPSQITPAVASGHLDRESEVEWDLTWWGAAQGGRAEGGPLGKGIRQLAGQVELPDPEESNLLAISANLLDPDSVRDNGHLVMLHLGRWATARDYLMTEPTIFADPEVEALRDTYLVGAVVVAYSPVGAQTDQTDGLRRFLPFFIHCAKVESGCQPPPSLLEFDEWKDRAADRED